uniref:Uncharacterized protein n=1 Tax=Cyprinus carpio TaxID=7962 RepID=A0A8C1X3Q5_CYPCA
MSRKEIPDEIYRYWSAVASSLRLGWLGTNNVRTEMKACQLGLFPNLLNSSAVEEDILGLEEHLRESCTLFGSGNRSKHHSSVPNKTLNRFSPLSDAPTEKPDESAVGVVISAGARLEKSSEELGKAGVSFNVSDAVCSDQPEMVKFCIRNGSDLEQSISFNNRPIDDAQRLGLQHMVELLSF